MTNKEVENKIKFSVVIPITTINDYLIETCDKLNKSAEKNFEILIFSNRIDGDLTQWENRLGARIIPAGDVSPAIKRDLALEHAAGEYLAFTDDDAYPDDKWLETAEQYLADEKVSAIGGPQMTPPNDSFWQKVSGAMFMSPLSGKAVIRYWPGKKVQEIDDWPTVNLIVKKKDFKEIGGFDTQFWPGEDTKLCLDLVKKSKKKILYVPSLIVYHHRRSGFGKHIKQVGNYGIHRGFFAKVFPETSLRFDRMYFVPSLFVIYLFLGSILSFLSTLILKIYLLGLAVYALALIYSTLSIMKKTGSFRISLMTIPYLISFHIWYGISFIRGFLFTKKLNSRLGR